MVFVLRSGISWQMFPQELPWLTSDDDDGGDGNQ
jgi:hypothetical protein